MGLAAEQKVFTAGEICTLLGITPEDLQSLVYSRHIGRCLPEGAGERYLFDRNDLAVLTVLSAQMVRRDILK